MFHSTKMHVLLKYEKQFADGQSISEQHGLLKTNVKNHFFLLKYSRPKKKDTPCILNTKFS